MSSSSDAPNSSMLYNEKKGNNDGIQLGQRISLLSGCAIIIGVIIGSGIFVSPKGVLEETGSVGMALLIWFLSGLFATLGALCYAELGTSIPKSGGDYVYIKEAFGDVLAFLFLWIALIIINPTSNTIVALTFANYALQPFYHGCDISDLSIRLVAACIISLLTFVNCYKVRMATRIQDYSTVAKLLALVIIIIVGFYSLIKGNTEHFKMPAIFARTKWQPGQIAVAFYSGMFSYAGWNYLNFVTEELKNPLKNLPRAIYISLPSVTLIYMLTNAAYFAVLTSDELLDSPAVAVTFADKVLGQFSLAMPAVVCISCIGGLNGGIFASSRMFFVGARDGQLLELLSMIIKYVTPMPSLIILGFFSLMMLMSNDVIALINYVSFAETSVVAIAVAGLLWMRFTRPQMNRPIKLNLIIPSVFFTMCMFLVVFPFFEQPSRMLVGLLMILSGLPVYFVFIYRQNKPKSLYKPWVNFTHGVQKLLWCVPGDESKTS